MSTGVLGTKVVVHVAIIVSDIEAKLKAWADVLGVPEPTYVITDTVDLAHTEYAGETSPARAKIASFRFDGFAIEMIEPVGGPSTWQDQLEQHGDSLQHLAFRVEGMEDKLTVLDQKGIPLIQKGDFKGGRYTYVDGTEQLGTMLELMELVP
jgi:catechol 2,3-dioxygenase-like lactoylglutathione lyase family enzyme